MMAMVDGPVQAVVLLIIEQQWIRTLLQQQQHHNKVPVLRRSNHRCELHVCVCVFSCIYAKTYKRMCM